jgi:hypothetical protein
MTFILGYGLTNFLFFLPADQLELLGLVPEITPSMVKLMGLVAVAVIAMWAGYWSPVAANLTRLAVIYKFQPRFLSPSHKPKRLTIPILVLIATGARLIQIKMGVFGYASTTERLIELGAVTQYLAMASSLGQLALVLAASVHYSSGQRTGVLGWYYIILILEVVWGLLSGFKSAVVLPFVIAGFCQYLITGKFPKRWATMAIVGIIAAFMVIEPFRAARNESSGGSITSLTDIVSLFSANQALAYSADDSAPVVLMVASRSNLTYIGSFGVDYSVANAPRQNDPDFLGDLLLAPVHAWIPRFIWESKPIGTLGLWYNQIVMGMSHDSSTAMGPIVYLYFAGGAAGIFLVFLIIGIIQRTLFFVLQPWTSLAGLMIFLAMLPTITIIDSAVNGIFVNLFRNIPLLLVVSFFLFSRSQPRGCRR